MLPIVASVVLVIGAITYLWVFRLEQTLDEAYRDKAISMVQVLDALGHTLVEHPQGVAEIQKHIDDPMTLNPNIYLFCDLDKFKTINDVYGHILGDRVLRGVSDIIGQSVRRIDIAARYGGDEFAIILPETDDTGAVQLAERLRYVVASHSFAGDESIEFGMTLSIGIALYPRDGQSREELVDKADRAMFAAKKLGGDALFEANRLSESRVTAS